MLYSAYVFNVLIFISFIFFLSKLDVTKRSKVLIILGSASIFLIISAFSPLSNISILVHIYFFYFFIRIFGKLIRKKIDKDFAKSLSIFITSVVIVIGYFVLSLPVYKKEYNISSSKVNQSLRIAQIADSHISNAMSGERFNDLLIKIENESPDLLVITGDFIDDYTKVKDFDLCVEGLKNFKSKYGVFYVYGNHDKAHYKTTKVKNDYFVKKLNDANVKILEDEIFELTEEYTILGRIDQSYKRKEISEFDFDDNKFIIDLNHQPRDYKNEAGHVDLVLSGHTHGGNMFPANLLVILSNDNVYGRKDIEGTTFITTSGVSQWGVFYNTAAYNEFVIINISR